MHDLAKAFGENAEVIADYSRTHRQQEFAASREEVLDLLKRRPCSLDDIAAGLAIHRNEAIKHVQHLMEEEVITAEARDKRTFYVVK
jgi:predicted ArsR family transcriptional regulator